MDFHERCAEIPRQTELLAAAVEGAGGEFTVTPKVAHDAMEEWLELGSLESAHRTGDTEYLDRWLSLVGFG